jgi:hypothetical protein
LSLGTEVARGHLGILGGNSQHGVALFFQTVGRRHRDLTITEWQPERLQNVGF